MTTQEKLEAFAPYIPHGVFVKTNYDSVFKMDIVNKISFSRTIDVVIDNDYKLILRPLSDLTKPCLEDGKVPIVELGKIVELLEPVSYCEITDFKGKLNGSCAIDRHDNQWLMFDFKEGFSMWHKPHSFKEHTLTLLDHQLQLFQQLIKWHFWLGNQSEFGKSIIDINTIKTN